MPCAVLLRGANDYMLDEMDRSLHDAFCIVKRVLESGSVVPGEYPLLMIHVMLPAWCPVEALGYHQVVSDIAQRLEV